MHRLCPMMIAALLVGAVVSNALAQPAPTGIAGGRAMGRTGPAAISLDSPGAAEPIHHLNQYPRKTVAGSQYFELSALLAAQSSISNTNGRATRRRRFSAGVGQAVIDAVKYNRDVVGLPEKDAIVIRLARALFRDHKVSSELWAKTVESLWTPGRSRDRHDDGRLRDGRVSADCGRSAVAAREEAALTSTSGQPLKAACVRYPTTASCLAAARRQGRGRIRHRTALERSPLIRRVTDRLFAARGVISDIPSHLAVMNFNEPVRGEYGVRSLHAAGTSSLGPPS